MAGGKKTSVTYKPENRSKFFKNKKSAFPEPQIDTNAPSFFTNLGKGELPHNQDISDVLNRTMGTLEAQKQNQQLNDRGLMLIDDAKDILLCLEKFILEKNSNEQVQALFNHSKYAAKDMHKAHIGRDKTSTSNTQLGSEMKQAMMQAKELAFIFVSSSEFRMLIAEGLELMRSFVISTTSPLDANGNPLSNKFLEDDPTITSICNLLQKLSAKSEYRKAIKNFFELFDHLQIKASEIKNGEMISSQMKNENLAQMKVYVQSLFEGFTGRELLDDFFKVLQGLYYEMKNDANAKNWLLHFRAFIIDSVKNPALLSTRDKREEIRNLINNGKLVVQSPRYKTQVDKLFEISKAILNKLKEDTSIKDLSSRFALFGQHIMLDNSGRPDPMVLSDSLKQLKTVIIPVISKNLESISIPRITGSNAFYDMAIENVILNGSGLIPDLLDFKFKTHAQMNVNRLASDTTSTKLTIIVKGMRTELKNIEYWFSKKTFPRIEDKGKIDVSLMDGEGIDLEISWTLNSYGNQQPINIELHKVKCSLDKLDVRVHHAKHNFIDKLGVSMFQKRIKKEFASAVVKSVVQQLEPISLRMNEYFASRPIEQLANRIASNLKPKPPVYHYSEEHPRLPESATANLKEEVNPPILMSTTSSTTVLPPSTMEVVQPINPDTVVQSLNVDQEKSISNTAILPPSTVEVAQTIPVIEKIEQVTVIPVITETSTTQFVPETTLTTQSVVSETVTTQPVVLEEKAFSWFAATEGSKITSVDTVPTQIDYSKINNPISSV